MACYLPGLRSRNSDALMFLICWLRLLVVPEACETCNDRSSWENTHVAVSFVQHTSTSARRASVVAGKVSVGSSTRANASANATANAAPAAAAANIAHKVHSDRDAIADWLMAGNSTASNSTVDSAESQQEFPEPSAIWNSSVGWETVKFRHPAGVISNANNKQVKWAKVSYESIEVICLLTLVAYPAALLVLFLCLTISVSMCMSHSCNADACDCDQIDSPAMPVTMLPPCAKLIFGYWMWFCRAIPSILVFGTPCILVRLSHPYPQEVFVVLLVVSSVFVFSNGLYMICFCPVMLSKMRNHMSSFPQAWLDSTIPRGAEHDVVHWVILPNYKEDIGVLTESIESVGQSGIARRQISVLLAMEDRETDAMDKALHLREKFVSNFRDVMVTFHPANLPNDPPGKASNVAWAFNWLLSHLEESHQDLSKVVLTIADADSDFHKFYFDSLTQQFTESDPERRFLTLWQAPVFHVKNYHRQPMPLIVGTMFTGITEMAVLSDPNSIKCPYSTYSLALELAKQVGGWDAEWIAEDWHMGIKCFLLTLGKTRIEPIPFPTVNYMPEGSSWLGTCYERWAQAKRHALGFSDMSYYFMMLPLLFCRISLPNKRGTHSLQDFWPLWFHGIAYIVKLVNTHVIAGIMTFYMVISLLLKNVMQLSLPDIRDVGQLFDRSSVDCRFFFVASIISLLVTNVIFHSVYSSLKDRMEPPNQSFVNVFSFKPLHWVYTLLACVVFAAFYCVGLAVTVWLAAIRVLVQASFEYEVASKPTKDDRL